MSYHSDSQANWFTYRGWTAEWVCAEICSDINGDFLGAIIVIARRSGQEDLRRAATYGNAPFGEAREPAIARASAKLRETIDVVMGRFPERFADEP